MGCETFDEIVLGGSLPPTVGFIQRIPATSYQKKTEFVLFGKLQSYLCSGVGFLGATARVRCGPLKQFVDCIGLVFHDLHLLFILYNIISVCQDIDRLF